MEDKKIDDNMELCEELIKVIGEDLKEVFTKEAIEPDFLNQRDFKNGEDRAVEAMILATKRASRILGLNIDIHRQDKHNEDTAASQKELEGVMGGEDKEVAKRGSWKW